MALRDARDADGGVVREHGLHALPHRQEDLPREGGREVHGAGPLEAVHEARGQRRDAPELRIVRPHHGERVHRLFFERHKLSLNSVPGHALPGKRLSLEPLGLQVYELLCILHRQGQQIDGKPQRQDLLEVVLEVTRRLRARGAGRRLLGVEEAEAAFLAKVLELQALENGPTRPTLDVSVLADLRGVLKLHLEPDLGQKLPHAHHEALAGRHVEHRRAALVDVGLRGSRCEKRPPEDSATQKARLPARGRPALGHEAALGRLGHHLLSGLHAHDMAGVGQMLLQIWRKGADRHELDSVEPGRSSTILPPQEATDEGSAHQVRRPHIVQLMLLLVQPAGDLAGHPWDRHGTEARAGAQPGRGGVRAQSRRGPP
mmetsp:Transcript_71239/g.204351  ORF Transcript_71239/g.204351 Transcript_71239/m.204351 type:complete len:373 (-) Transcript_71239:87-1205(-)